MAQIVIEATIRDLAAGNHEATAHSLFVNDPRLQRIRILRNELVHPHAPGSPSIVWRVAGGDIASNHALLEADAKDAVDYLYYLVYRKGVA